VTRRAAAFTCAALAAPVLALPVLAALAAPAQASESPHPAASSTWYAAPPSLPTLVPPVLPPLELSAFTSSAEPVAGQDYLVQVTVKNVGRSAAQQVRLSLRLSPDLRLASVPADCTEIDGIPAPALECGWGWLGSGSEVTVPLVVRPCYPGYIVAIGAILRYDWGLWAYANIIRQVQHPPPAPSPSPSPPSPSPRPSPSPHLTSPTPRPVPRVVKAVVPPVRTSPPPRKSAPPSAAPKATPAPKPKPKPAPKPAPKRHPRPRPQPSSTAFPHIVEMPVLPASSNKPVIPLAVLITAVLTPCVAAAATRFGKR